MSIRSVRTFAVVLFFLAIWLVPTRASDPCDGWAGAGFYEVTGSCGCSLRDLGDYGFGVYFEDFDACSEYSSGWFMGCADYVCANTGCWRSWAAEMSTCQSDGNGTYFEFSCNNWVCYAERP
jgi:hypothetical protein